MAVNQIDVAASPEAVRDVLADPRAYAQWVLGTQRIRGADDRFPEEGTRLYHTIGAGPVTLSDTTSVVAAEPVRRLVLDARLGPLGTARVVIELREHERGTAVELAERGTKGTSRLLYPAGELVLRGRNRWSLDRLKALVESRA